MRDLGIDPEFEVSTDFSKEAVDIMVEDFIVVGNDWLDDYISDEASYDKVHNIVSDCINKLAENNRHIDGKVYIFDWDMWDYDLAIMVKRQLENASI